MNEKDNQKDNIFHAEGCDCNIDIDDIRKSVHEDAHELFACALRGGTLGVYLKEGLPFYFISEQLLSEMNMTQHEYVTRYDGILLNTIHPEDRKQYVKETSRALKQNCKFDMICRVLKEESYCYMRDIGKKVTLENDTEIFLILRSNVTDIFEYQDALEKQAVSYAERNKELEAVTANIPGGVCGFCR